jgi:hypothetical protein
MSYNAPFQNAGTNQFKKTQKREFQKGQQSLQTLQRPGFLHFIGVSKIGGFSPKIWVPDK